MQNPLSRSRLIALILALAASGSGAAGPTSGELAEVRAGARYHEKVIIEELGTQFWDDPEMARYVDAVGQRLVRVSDRPTLPFKFFLEDRREPNAAATMGGYVYVSRGLLALIDSEAQLAGILAHEIGHITHKHLIASRSRERGVRVGAFLAGFLTGSYGLYDSIQQTGLYGVSRFRRSAELEADRSGVRYTVAAGYDPEGLIDGLGALHDYQTALQQHGIAVKPYHGIHSSHPKTERRFYEMFRLVERTQGVEVLDPIESDYLSLIDGMPWQETVNDGLVRDGVYYNGRRGVVVTFPDGWDVATGGNFVRGQSVRGAWIQFETYTLEASEAERDPPRLERFLTEELNLELEPGGREFEAEGFPGLLAIVRNPPEDDSYARRMVAVIFKDKSAFVLRGENLREPEDAGFIDTFARTVGSFRRITDWELENIRGQRIVVREAKPGWTYESLARRAGLGREGADLLRVINSDFPNGEPRAGDRIKLIE